MTHVNLITSAILLLISSGVIAKEAPKTPSSQFAQIVETLLADMTSSTYQHKTEINEETGVWNCDCSGLIGHILRRHFPEAYLHVDGPTRPERARPLAANYCETFLAAGQKKLQVSPWKQITKVTDLRPGDIFAWKNLKIVKGKSTGHVLMIAGIPKLDDNGLYRVRIIDSTRGLHANDSRTQETLGVGSGDIWLSADKDGKLNGFKNSNRRPLTLKHTIAAGRIVTLTGPVTPTNKEDRDYLNLTPEAAQALAKKRNLKSRIISQDGESISVTRKIEKNRINFVIEAGKVTRIARG